MPNPDPLLTRHTLIHRLRDSADEASWAEFAKVYTPLLYSYCQKRELRHADIADIVQEVMRSVSLALAKNQYDPAKGKFRAWLFTTLRNTVFTHYRKRARVPLTPGETAVIEALDTEPTDTEHQEWEHDYQRQLIRWAMEKIKPELAPHVWRAFELTALEDKTPAEAAAETGMTKNAVGVAKHRVSARLREMVNSVDADEWEQEMVGRLHSEGGP